MYVDIKWLQQMQRAQWSLVWQETSSFVTAARITKHRKQEASQASQAASTHARRPNCCAVYASS